MFDKEFISKLGKKSISRNPALTKERVNAVWTKANKEKKQSVLDLADVPASTAYRVRSTGIITVKMTIAFSQIFNLDPYYLIGAAPENAGYSFELAKRLLIEHKYGPAVKDYMRTYKPAVKNDPPPAEVIAAPEAVAPVKELSTQAAIQKLSEDDMVTLLRGLIIKAGTGKLQAIADVTKITEILLG